MASKVAQIRSAEVFVMVMPGGWPIASTANGHRREVVAWANEDTQMGGWRGLRKRGYSIEKMMLVPLGEHSE
ncbi:hypothetical protein [Brucella pituitosa]|uniref:hypothetical protein n=1 Tax=Brucella pituitosa TaxID=571256 RepID=UPI003F4ABC46